MSHDPAASGPWHVDKRIPVALIGSLLVGLILQTLTVGVWAGTVQQRLEQLEQMSDKDRKLASDMGVVKEQIIQINKTLDRLVDRLDNGGQR